MVPDPMRLKQAGSIPARRIRLSLVRSVSHGCARQSGRERHKRTPRAVSGFRRLRQLRRSFLVGGGSIVSGEMSACFRPARFVISTSLAVSALLVLTSGCGGGNKSSGPSTSGPTHAHFVSELDAWCARGNRKFAPLIAQFNNAGLANDAGAAATALQRTIPLRACYDARLREMTPSPEDRATFARYLRDETRIAGLSPRMVAALKARDEEEFNRLANLVHATRNDRTKVALDLGTTQCGT